MGRSEIIVELNIIFILQVEQTAEWAAERALNRARVLLVYFFIAGKRCA